MKLKSYFSKFADRLNLYFTPPEKKIAGKWDLYEFYTEPGDGLNHVKEDDLKQKDHFMQIYFRNGGVVNFDFNIDLPLWEKNTNLQQWEITRNFIKIYDSQEQDSGINFQFAFRKNHLRLLNKDKSGKIQFFGFFRKQET